MKRARNFAFLLLVVTAFLTPRTRAEALDCELTIYNCDGSCANPCLSDSQDSCEQYCASCFNSGGSASWYPYCYPERNPFYCQCS